jgi:hypothetical protein
MACASKNCIVDVCLGVLFLSVSDLPRTPFQLYAFVDLCVEPDISLEVEECGVLVQILNEMLVTSIDWIASGIHGEITETGCVATRVEDHALVD